ncbi:MAG: phosphotransferase, partial [bacterium]
MSQSASQAHPYEQLTPDRVLAALEQLDFRCDGRLLALNSYENRVYQVGIEDDTPVIAKFYRPARWTREAIQEEHDFSLELADQEIPVIAPFRTAGSRS